MDKSGWLVNDCLTCIPGTTTFWHNLLEWFPNLIDETNGYTNYNILATNIENQYAKTETKPYYIIRNGTYFRFINIPAKQISLIQDVRNGSGFLDQCNIINKSAVSVFNTNYVYNKYKPHINTNSVVKIIPLGVNFNFFKPIPDRHPDVLPNSVIFIGSSTTFPKGFDIMKRIISNMTDTNFCLVMKDNFNINNIQSSDRSRVKIFNRVNMETVRLLINSCVCGVCTSREETQHLSGIECGACNIPMIGANVGFYNDCKEDKDWGCTSTDGNFSENIRYVMNNLDKYNPREYLINKYSTEVCENNWKKLIESL